MGLRMTKAKAGLSKDEECTNFKPPLSYRPSTERRITLWDRGILRYSQVLVEKQRNYSLERCKSESSLDYSEQGFSGVLLNKPSLERCKSEPSLREFKCYYKAVGDKQTDNQIDSEINAVLSTEEVKRKVDNMNVEIKKTRQAPGKTASKSKSDSDDKVSVASTKMRRRSLQLPIESSTTQAPLRSGKSRKSAAPVVNARKILPKLPVAEIEKPIADTKKKQVEDKAKSLDISIEALETKLQKLMSLDKSVKEVQENNPTDVPKTQNLFGIEGRKLRMKKSESGDRESALEKNLAQRISEGPAKVLRSRSRKSAPEPLQADSTESKPAAVTVDAGVQVPKKRGRKPNVLGTNDSGVEQSIALKIRKSFADITKTQITYEIGKLEAKAAGAGNATAEPSESKEVPSENLSSSKESSIDNLEGKNVDSKEIAEPETKSAELEVKTVEPETKAAVPEAIAVNTPVKVPKKRGRKKGVPNVKRSALRSSLKVSPRRTIKVPSRFLETETPLKPKIQPKEMATIQSSALKSEKEKVVGQIKERRKSSVVDEKPSTSKLPSNKAANNNILSKETFQQKVMAAKSRSEKRNAAAEAARKEKAAALEVLNKTQAEYAVSALYNYKHQEGESESPPSKKDKTNKLETQGLGKKRRRKKLKKLLKQIGTHRSWSQARIDSYKNRRKRQKCTTSTAERELKRLGHVIINVGSEAIEEVASDEKEEVPECAKEFCKLGCVCKSLEVPMREEFHCGKEECIFQCLCSQAGASNCLFDSRVQDKTRNLAPEEKEFIKTVISQGKESLVVAERAKRERKMPQRLQADFVTGEELDLAGIGRKKLGARSSSEGFNQMPRKRLLSENWEMTNIHHGDRERIVPSPDFLENRCSKNKKYFFLLEPATKTSGTAEEGSEEKIPPKTEEPTDEPTKTESSMMITEDGDEDVTPKIVSIASIDPAEFESAENFSKTSFNIPGDKSDLEIVNEVTQDSPTSFGMVEARQKAKVRAMELLPQFKESIINAYNFKPSMMTINKFCIVDWQSFTSRFNNCELFIWVEKEVSSKHAIAVITDVKKEPYRHYVDVNEMAKYGLPQGKTFDNLNLKENSPKCPFILWCNGQFWEILGKLSNSLQNRARIPPKNVNPAATPSHLKSQNNSRLYPEKIQGNELPAEFIASKWYEIPAMKQDAFTRLDVVEEHLSINYTAICKLLKIAINSKTSFVSKIKKLSAPHLHKDPFGLYSIPTKSSIFLGPYGQAELPKVRLVPLPGVKEIQLKTFTLQQTDYIQPRRPKKPDLSPKAQSSAQPDSDTDSCEYDDGELDKADVAFLECNQSCVNDVACIIFENGMLQLKHPMGSKLLLFESEEWATKFLEYIYQDLYDTVIWELNYGMSSNCSLQDYTYLKMSKGIKIATKDMVKHFNSMGDDDVMSRTVRQRSKPLKFQEASNRRKTSLEVALARSDWFKERIKRTAKKGEEEESSPAKVMKLSETGLGTVESPLHIAGEGEDNAKTIEKLRDQYRQDIKEAFEQAGELYSSPGDDRNSRVVLLRKMKNEIELLKLQERALVDEMEGVLVEKANIFKKFSGLPKEDRKDILLALNDQQAKDTNSKDVKRKNVIEPTPLKITPEQTVLLSNLIAVSEHIESDKEENILEKTSAMRVDPPALKVVMEPDPSLKAGLESAKKVFLVEPSKKMSVEIPENRPYILKDVAGKTDEAETVLGPPTMISLATLKGGEFLKLTNSAVITSSPPNLPMTLQSPKQKGVNRLTSASVKKISSIVKQVAPSLKKSVDAANNVKAKVPWVKCIPSIGALTSTEDKIKGTKEKGVKPQQREEIPLYEDDDLAGMPVLTPASSTNFQPNLNGSNSGQKEDKEFVVQPLNSLSGLKDAGFSGINDGPDAPVNLRKGLNTGTSAGLSAVGKKNYSQGTLDIAMHYIKDEGMSVTDAAKSFGVPCRTLYSRLQRAKDKIKIEPNGDSSSSIEEEFDAINNQ